jgi:hypothetical protein
MVLRLAALAALGKICAVLLAWSNARKLTLAAAAVEATKVARLRDVATEVGKAQEHSLGGAAVRRSRRRS